MRYKATVEGSAGFIIWDNEKHKIWGWINGSEDNAKACAEALNTIDKIEHRAEIRRGDIMRLVSRMA